MKTTTKEIEQALASLCEPLTTEEEASLERVFPASDNSHFEPTSTETWEQSSHFNEAEPASSTEQQLDTPFLDSMTYVSGPYRDQTTPVKIILHVNAFEELHGPLWAVTAQFSEDVEELLRQSSSSPTTFLMKRFHSVFGNSVPRLGMFERPGNTDAGRLHVHMLLSRRQFPDPLELKKQLFRVFGKRIGVSSQIQIKPTDPEIPYEQKGPLGVFIGGAAGFLLYSAKDTIGTRSWLDLKRRRYKHKARADLSGRRANKQLKKCLDAYDLKSKNGVPLNTASFFFDDLIFRSQELGQQAEELWDHVRPEFIEAYLNNETKMSVH
jgi:hypothetical protein